MLRERGWQVRGTARRAEGLAAIEGADLEGVRADPDRLATLLDHVADVAVVAWLMGSATGNRDAVAALHGARLERLLAELVDTPVRGIVYEAAGSAGASAFSVGRRTVAEASERWRIPVRVLGHDPADWRGWVEEAAAAVSAVIGSGPR